MEGVLTVQSRDRIKQIEDSLRTDPIQITRDSILRHSDHIPVTLNYDHTLLEKEKKLTVKIEQLTDEYDATLSDRNVDQEQESKLR